MLVVIILILIGAGAYTLRGKVTSADKPRISSADQPRKTSASNGYVEQKGAPVAAGSMAVVDDADDAAWVKVPSKVKLDKFTDMSANKITIYRINNPDVLKQ